MKGVTTIEDLDNALALRVDRVAQLLDCSESKIYDLIKDGRLQAVKLSGGKKAGIRVLTASIKTFIDGGVCQAPELTPAERVAAVQARNRRSSKEWF